MAFSLRKGKAAVLKAAAIGLALLIVALAAFVAWLIRSPLPKINGTLIVDGIQASVTIRRDTRGIPHIEASSEPDLFFGEGFVCAQDRLWQMDLLRRTAEGKLSEVVGPAALEVDRYMRTIGLGAAAGRDASVLSGSALRDVEAYAAGVNAAASTHPLPLEFKLLGYRPQLWTPKDSIAIVKLMAQRLDDLWGQVELRAVLQRRIGVQAANALMSTRVVGLEHFIGGQDATRLYAASAASASGAGVSQFGEAQDQPPLPPDPQSGSNNWSVAGSLVTTGKPVLSNDTHLGHSVPSTYWLAHLHGAGFNVEGFIIPGIPGIALGHNQRIAFGVTSGAVAVQDIFVERFRSHSSDEYIANGHWVRATHRVERIAIKGAKPLMLDVLVTRHGPLIKRKGNSANALAWTILRSGDEIDLLRRLDLAANWRDFQTALSKVVGPIFNWAYADVDGNIGYHLAGWVPNRLNGNGSLPVEGADDRYNWHGYIPFDQLSHALNPRCGFVATANNQLAPASTPIGMSPFFDYPYRVDRIYRELGRHSKMTPQAIGSIQADVYDLARLKLAAVTAKALRNSSDARLRRLAVQLVAWDGMATGASTIPTFLVAEERALEDHLLIAKLGPALLDRYRHDFNALVPFERVLDGDRSLESISITRNSLFLAIPEASKRAADALRIDAALGLGEIKPWGQQNAAIYDHPVGRVWPLDAILNIRSFPQAGDGLTVYAAKPDHGPASRLVADLSNWDNSSMVLTLGESGQFNDPHYQDQVEDFRHVKWVPTPFSDAAVKAATKDTLVLNP